MWRWLACLVIGSGCGRIGFDTGHPGVPADGPLDPSLIAWFPFDDGSGAVAHDATGHGHDGILVNGEAWSSDGMFDGAIELDGIDDAIEIPAPASFVPTGDFTYVWWERPTSAIQNQTMLFLDNTTSPQLQFKHVGIGPVGSLEIYTDNHITLGVYDLDNLINFWHQIAVTRAGDVVTAYVDGQLEVTDTMSLTITFGGDCVLLLGQIGCHSDPSANQPFAGLLDDLRIYDRALSQSEL